MIKREFVFFKDACIVIVATALLIITASGLHSAGTSGAAILKYNPGPRYQAMAGAGTASEEDFSATGWNPALLGTLKGLNIATLYYSAFEGANLFYAGTGIEIGPGSLALKGTYFTAGDILINDVDDPLNGSTLNAQTDLIYSICYGLKLSDYLYLGAAGKYYSSVLIEKYDASTFAGDAGVLIKTGFLKTGRVRFLNQLYSTGLNLGLSVLNVGSDIYYIDEKNSDPIPMILRGGISYDLRFTPEHKIIIAAEVNDDNENDIKGGGGLEYINNDLFFLRTGYRVNYEIKHFTWGLGIKYGKIKFDYGMGINTAINSEHNIMLSWGMGRNKEKISDYKTRNRITKKEKKEKVEKENLNQKNQEKISNEKNKINKSEIQDNNIAVLDLEARPPLAASEAAFISDFLRTDLVRKGKLNIVEKNNMDVILAEQGFQNTGCTTSECATKLGKILNVNNIIIGSVGKLADNYIISISVVDIETAQIIYSDDDSCESPNKLRDTVAVMAEKFNEYLSKK